MKKRGYGNWLIDLAGYDLSRFVLEYFYIPRLVRRAYVKREAAVPDPEPVQNALYWLQTTVRSYFAEYLPDRDSTGLAAAFLSHFRARIVDDIIFSGMSVKKQHAFFNNRISVAGRENLHTALAAAQGIILTGAHFGSVIRAGLVVLKTISEAMPKGNRRTFCLCSEPVFLKQPGIAGLQTACSRFYGTEIRFIDTGTGSTRVIREIIKALDDRCLVAVNMEVVSGGSSRLPFPLFGKAVVRLPSLVAACFCAFHARAALLPWYNVRDEKGGNLLTFEAPFLHTGAGYLQNGSPVPDYKKLAFCLAAILEKWITARPGQWMYWDRFGRMLG